LDSFSPLWAFSDESGNLAHDDRYVIIAVVMANDPKSLNQAVKRARQRTPKYSKPTSYLHATKDAPAVTTALLTQLRDVQIGLTLFDKQWWWRRDLHPDTIYELLVSYALETALATAHADPGQVQIVIESRYIGTRRLRLMYNLADNLGLDLNQVHSEGKTDSEWGPSLQVADAIAWSWYQKVERGNASYADLVANYVVCENHVGLDASGRISLIEDMRNQ
jgi:hypothetical protein